MRNLRAVGFSLALAAVVGVLLANWYLTTFLSVVDKYFGQFMLISNPILADLAGVTMLPIAIFLLIVTGVSLMVGSVIWEKIERPLPVVASAVHLQPSPRRSVGLSGEAADDAGEPGSERAVATLGQH